MDEAAAEGAACTSFCGMGRRLYIPTATPVGDDAAGGVKRCPLHRYRAVADAAQHHICLGHSNLMSAAGPHAAATVLARAGSCLDATCGRLDNRQRRMTKASTNVTPAQPQQVLARHQSMALLQLRNELLVSGKAGGA